MSPVAPSDAPRSAASRNARLGLICAAAFFGMVGMAIAVFTTAALIVELAGQMGQTRAQGMVWVLGGLIVGGNLLAGVLA